MNIDISRRTHPFHPASMQPRPNINVAQDTGQHPVSRTDQPDSTPDKVQDVPPGWIDGATTRERLSLAGIEQDDRRIRYLCKRNVLENKKVKNERNQWQYFINPASVDKYINRNRPEQVPVSPANAGQEPDQSTVIRPDAPGQQPDENPKEAVNTVPATSGQTEQVPDKSKGGDGLEVELATAQATIAGLEVLVEQLREDKKHLRDELKQSHEMRKHDMTTLTQGYNNTTSEMLGTIRSITTQQTLPSNHQIPQSPKPVPWHEGEVG